MKKITILIFSILLVNTVLATDSLVFKLRKRDYKHVDSISQTYKTVDEAISKISLFKEDVDKARAVYNFVASYMTYELYPELIANKPVPIDRQTAKVSLPISIKTRKGVCYDYAVLYEYICEKVGLECAVVSGIVKENWNARHGWNVVTIDSKMYILDVTYADNVLGRYKSIEYNTFLIPSHYAITYWYPTEVQCIPKPLWSNGHGWEININDKENFDKEYKAHRKEYDEYYSCASKYQCLEKPMSIYYFAHSVVIGDEDKYVKGKYGFVNPSPKSTKYTPLPRVAANDPNIYIKYFYDFNIRRLPDYYYDKNGNIID